MSWLIMVCAAVGLAFAQDGPQAGSKRQFVDLVAAPAIKVAANGTGRSSVSFRVKPEMHVNSHTPHSDLLIPTELDFKPPSGIVIKPVFPAGHDIALAFEPKEKISVYTGDFAVGLTATAKGAKAGTAMVPATLKYQACNASSCFPPKSIDFDVEVQVDAAR